MRKILSLSVLLISFHSVTGCVSSASKIMKTDKDMKDVIAELEGGDLAAARNGTAGHFANNSTDMGPYTRSVTRETELLFTTLPNPKLQMYVFPHITEGGLAIPGYSVEFSMYETDQYALPGELSGWD